MQFALAFAALLCCVLCALAAKKGKLAKSKIAQIQEAAPVLALTDSNFKKYITDRPREYHSVLMLTATDPKYRCTICQRAKNALVDAAKSYHAQFSFNTSSISERIAFFTVEVDDAPNLFNELRVETVPHVYVLPPADEQSKKTSLPSYEVDTKAYMEGLSSIFAQLAAVTGVKVKALIDPWPAIIFASLVAIVIALFMSVASYGFFNALLSYQSPAIWRVVSMICFGVGVSGCIYCIIHGSPLLGNDRAGRPSLFASQGREQFLLEGVVVALLTLSLALSYRLLYNSTWLRFPLLRHVLVIFWLAVLCTIGAQLWSSYILKTPWYSLRDTVPPELWRSLASPVKKTSGLAKRLQRISEIWLFEAKDWESFLKKVDSLVVEYVRRQWLASN